MSLQGRDTLFVEETKTLPGGLLIDGGFRREEGKINLHIRSTEIREFFRGLPQAPEEGFHKGWKLSLFTPAKFPRLPDVEFNSQSSDFMVNDSNRGVYVANMTFLRAKDLHTGVIVPIGPLVMHSDFEDMKKSLKLAVTELYRSYIADFEDTIKITTHSTIKVA